MHNWDREQQDNKFRQKLNNVKSTLPKINHPNTTTNISTKNKNGTVKLPFTKNIRKQNNLKYILREFGLSQYIRKLFDLGYDDSNVIKLGLLTQKQFEELLFNLKIFPGHQVKFTNLYEYLKQKNASTQRRKPNTSSGSKAYTGSNRRLQKIKTKAISANQRNVKQSNTIVNSFINGNFGYNYYLSNNKAQLDKEGSDDGNKTIRNENDDMSEEIDEMLKYYMDQLNEKLDDSYDSVQDSSLSQVVTTNQNEKKKQNEYTKDKVNPPIGKKSIPIRLPSITNNETNPVKDSSIKTEDKNNIIPIVKIPEQILDNIPQKEELEEKEDNHHSEDEKEDDDLYFEPHEQVINEHQEEIHTEPNILKEEIPTQKENEKPPQVSSSLLKAQTTQYKIIQQTNEQDVYNNLRLTKSSEGDYIRQNLYQFDIEYMCRCLGLAIMKHIESGKDKQHITELLDIKDNFSFFNSLYNSKMDFLFNFFDKELNPSQMSNLDRIDFEEHQKQKEHISFANHFKQKKDEELLKQTEEKDKIKFHSNYGDIEKDIKFIDEFFSVSNKKKKNYLNLSEKTKTILNKELSYINEVDSDIMNSKLNSSGNNTNRSELSKKGYENVLKQSIQNMISKEEEDYDNKFTSIPNKINDESYKQTPLISKITEELPKEVDISQKEEFESGEMESNYLIDASTIEKLKTYITKQSEIFDDDYVYSLQRIQTRKYVPPPDPQQIFEFCANVMCLTKMEKEVIIITLIYIERLMFNTGLLLTSRNWRRISFTAMIIASKIWDDDSFENNHFAQVFTHLSIGEINLLERTFLELINYKVYVKCSEYFKYFFIIKSIALKYNYNGMNIVPISVEKMMKIQEYAYQMQKKVKKNYALNNSAQF